MRTSPFTPKSGLLGLFYLCFDDHGSFRNLSVGFQSDPNICAIRTSTMTGMPIHVPGVLLRAMCGELSRVRTEL